MKKKSKVKIQKFTFCFVILLFTFFILHSSCYAQPVTSSELINNSKEYDGKSVVYEGEAVGDVMRRGQFAWANLNDGENAIGIWVSQELASQITHTGSYKYKGDRLEVTGIFHRACPEHGGDMDIHAQAMRKINPGEKTPETMDTSKRNLLLILTGVLLGLWIFRRLIKR